MCRLRVHVQYRSVPGIQAHQLRHVRCLKAAPADSPSDGSEGAAGEQDAGTPGSGVDADPAGQADLVATSALTLSQWLQSSPSGGHSGGRGRVRA